MKSNYVIRATKFMEQFYPYLYKYNIEKAVTLFNNDKHRSVIYRHGIARRVLITSDYVVKWDFDKKNCKVFGGCVDEYNRYLKLKDTNYFYLFAEITPIRIKNRTFYVMPRVDYLGVDVNKDIYEVLEPDEYDFICDYGIGDIHDENWGYFHGVPLIIDYACGCESAS